VACKGKGVALGVKNKLLEPTKREENEPNI